MRTFVGKSLILAAFLLWASLIAFMIHASPDSGNGVPPFWYGLIAIGGYVAGYVMYCAGKRLWKGE